MGTIKGVGRIYQQTVIETYSRVAFAGLYTSKYAITSADVLNDRVILFFEQHALPILRMLTDRGSEFNGRPENHEYELYLQLEGIEHSRTKVRHPQSNGICERLHRTMQDEFYAVTFRKKTLSRLSLLAIRSLLGCIITTRSVLIVAANVLVKRQWKHFWNTLHWPNKNC